MAAYAEMSAGMDGYSAMPQMMDIAAKTKGYRIQMGENDADFMWYQKTFPNNYSTGKVPERTKDKNAYNAVKMPD